MPLSMYTKNKVLEHIHGKTSFTMPTAYVGFSTTTPNASDGNVTEPVGNGYARVQTTAAAWGAAASGAITNQTVLTWPTATGSGWGTVTNVVVYDAPTGGNLLFFATITSQNVVANVTPSIPVGDADSSIT